MTLQQFFERLGLRHFSWDEFLVATGCEGNEVPPRDLWPNVVPAALLVDRLRAKFGKALRLTSTYRAPAYNRRVGGVRLSQHQAFRAIDFQTVRPSPPDFYRSAGETLREWRGRRFDSPVRIFQEPVEVPAGEVPFEPLPVWDRRGGSGSLFEFHGGIGVYRTFVHLDCRGFDRSWSGS